MSADRRRGGVARHAAVLAAFTVAAVVFTWPLARHPASLLGATTGPGDAFLNLWVLGWDLQTISSHPAWLLTGRIFDANIFYPASGTLAYSDHQILPALAVWPAFAATRDLALCYNLVLVGSLVLAAWAMFAFVDDVLADARAALVAGLIWGFCPFHFGHLVHLQLQSLYFLPLAFLVAVRLVVKPSVGRGAALGLVAGLETLSSIYWGLIGGLGVAVAVVAIARATGRLRSGRFVAALATGVVVAVAVSAPGVWPYWQAQQREGFARNLFEAGHGSAAVASYVQAPPVNVLYGRSGWLRPPAGGGGPLGRKDGPEQDLFAGFTVIALAGLGLVRARAVGAPVLARAAVAVAAVGFVLSLGPDGIRVVYAALYHHVFGFQAIRAPARFSVLVFFALAMLASLAVARRGTAPALVCAVLVSIEFFNGSIPYVPAPPQSSDVGRWLHAQQGDGAVLYLPLTIDADNTRFMVASLEHRRPIVNGYSGQRPAFYPALVDLMAAFPSPDALLALRDIGVRFLVTAAPVRDAPPPLVERARFGGGVVYEAVWTPAIERALASAAEGPEPPPAGEVPFANAETMRYTVRWLNGPVALPAGDITATAAREPDGFALSVSASTAPWVRSFYDARDTFTTTTDARLLPRTHRQDLHEGRRQVVRTVTFDRGARRVTVRTGEAPPVALPLGAWARDPLGALLYVRTQPIAEGLHVRLPVTDVGRALQLDVRVTGADTIDVNGQQVAAWRIDARLSARVERRPPPSIVVWLSRGPRRVPLRARVSAEFGSIEMNLAGYDAR